jgi:hypothetical protein
MLVPHQRASWQHLRHHYCLEFLPGPVDLSLPPFLSVPLAPVATHDASQNNKHTQIPSVCSCTFVTGRAHDMGEKKIEHKRNEGGPHTKETRTIMPGAPGNPIGPNGPGGPALPRAAAAGPGGPGNLPSQATSACASLSQGTAQPRRLKKRHRVCNIF